MTSTRTSLSALASAAARRRPVMTSHDMALRRSGLLIVTRAMWSRTSYSNAPFATGGHGTVHAR